MTAKILIIMFMIVLLSMDNNTYASVVQPQSYVTAQIAGMDSAIVNNYYSSISTHFAYIFNDNLAQSIFLVTFTICAANNGCVTNTVTKVIQSHSDANVSWSMVQNVRFLLPGRYTLTASSSIIGPGLNMIASGTATANVILPY